MIFNNQICVVIGIILLQVCYSVAMSPNAGGGDLGLYGSNIHSNAGNRRVRSNIRPTSKMTKESHPMLASIYGTVQNVRVWSGQTPLKAPTKGAYGKSSPERTKYYQKSESLSLSEEMCNLCTRANDLDCIMRHCFNTVPTNIKLKTADLLSENIDNHTPNKHETKLTDFQAGKFALGNFEKRHNCKDPISIGHARRCKRQATMDTYEPAIDPKDRMTMLQIHQENERKQLLAQQNHMKEMQRQLRLAEAIQQEQIKQQQIAHALYNKQQQDQILLANQQHQRQLEMQAELELAEEIQNNKVKLQQMKESQHNTHNYPPAHMPSKQTSYDMNQQAAINLDSNQHVIPGIPKLVQTKPIQQSVEHLKPVETIGKHLYDMTQQQQANEQQKQLELAKHTQQEQIQEQLLAQQRQQQHQQKQLDSAIQQQRDQVMQQHLVQRQQQEEQLLQQRQQTQQNLQQSKRLQRKLKNQQKNKKRKRLNGMTKKQRQLARRRRMRRKNERRINKLNQGKFKQNKNQVVLI